MKKFFVFLLVVICLGMGVGVVYMKSSEDNEGPKITFEEGKDTNYTSDMTEEDLLKDVKTETVHTIWIMVLTEARPHRRLFLIPRKRRSETWIM